MDGIVLAKMARKIIYWQLREKSNSLSMVPFDIGDEQQHNCILLLPLISCHPSFINYGQFIKASVNSYKLP